MNLNKYNKQVMLNNCFCTIFIIDYNLISYANNSHIRTRAVSLQLVTCIK